MPEAGSPATLREQGNDHFKAGRFEDAITCYRQALDLLPPADSEEVANETCDLHQAVRLNLASCLLKKGSNFEEAVALCDDALSVDPSSAKALFRRGSARRELARKEAQGQRDVLVAARADLVAAARLEPADRQVRAVLDEVTEALQALPMPSKGVSAFCSGLYDDRQAEPDLPPPPPVVCSECGRLGHPRCGRACWVAQRATWLGCSEEEAGLEPESFEDDGTLLPLRAAAAAAAGLDRGSLSDMSDDEREALEDCLDSTERPFPQPKRQLPLAQAVRCAEEVWAEED